MSLVQTSEKSEKKLLKPDSTGINLAIVIGVLSKRPETREVQDRGEVVSLQVRVTSPDGATSVPVTMWSPPAWLLAAGEGTPVLVTGIVRTRFWRTGTGATASRVEVEATSVTRDGRRQRLTFAKRAETLLGEIL